MKQILLVLGSIFSSLVFGQNHTISWIHTFGGNTDITEIHAIGKRGTDIITGGGFSGNGVNMANGSNFTISSNGSLDAILNGYLAGNGNTNYNLHVGGTLMDYFKDVEVDGSGNIIVYGTYAQQIDLDTTAIGVNLLNGLAGQDAFLAKYSSTGALLWSINIIGKSQDLPTVLKLDAAGNSYIAFNFLDTIYPNPSAPTFFLEPVGGSDICIAKYDATGTFVWAKQIGGVDDDIVNDLFIHSNGNISSVGYFNTAIDFDPNAGVVNRTASNGSVGFLWTLDNTGNYVSVDVFEGTAPSSNVICKSLDVDLNSNYYIAGTFSGTVDLDPTSNTDIKTTSQFGGFMLSLDASGSYRWGNDIAFAAGTDEFISLKCASNRYYVAGNFSQTIDLDPSANTTNIHTTGSDIFITAYDFSGNFIWAKQSQSSNIAQVNDLYIDGNGAIYLAGKYSGTTNFNMNAGTTNKSTAANAYEAFVLKLTECTQTTSGTHVVASCGSYTWIDGQTYTTSNNTATFTLQGINQFGCDSIVTLNLTMGSSVHKTDVITVCSAPFTWIDGNQYSSNTSTATHLITGANPGDCDTLVTLNLTVGGPNTGTDIRSECDSLVWIDGNTYYSSTSTPTFTIIGGNQFGCDSTITLNLTINQTAHGVDIVTTCNAYEWIDGVAYFTDNNTATHTIPGGAASGCDSIVTLNLTIIPTPSSIDTISACGSHSWINGVTYYNSDYTAQHIIPSNIINGCDSIVYLNLTIHPIYSLVDTIHSCTPIKWIDGNIYSSSNNTAIYHVLSSAGCDSTVSLHLTIPTLNTNVSFSAQTYTLTSLENNATSYQWFDCVNNVPVLNETNQTFTPTQNGKYAIKVTKDGCTEMSDCFTIAGISVKENSIIQSIFPNPTNGAATIAFGQTIEKGTIEVLDISGKVLSIIIIENNNQVVLNLENYASGIYLIKANNGKVTAFHKLIKE